MAAGIVGWKATKRGERWAALEPLYQGVRYAFGGIRKDVARGLTVRSDNVEWLVERRNDCTPRAIRAKLKAAA